MKIVIFDASAIWYHGVTGKYNKRYDCFKEKFFKPFIELLEWYIYESETKVKNDYYLKNAIKIITSKLDEILLKQELASEIICNEIDELKELILFLNKKNWGQIVKGKPVDLVYSGLLSNENATSLFKYISENAPFIIKTVLQAIYFTSLKSILKLNLSHYFWTGNKSNRKEEHYCSSFLILILFLFLLIILFQYVINIKWYITNFETLPILNYNFRTMFYM